MYKRQGYERQKLAESLWHLYHDLSEEARAGSYLAILHQEPFRGFPDETADLAEKLDDPRFHATLVQQYSEFRKTLAENPDLLRFHSVSYTHLFAADMAPKPDTINTMNEEETQNEI